MKNIKTLILLFLIAAPLGAVTPMNYYTNLVAGDDDPGYQDGAFDEARFDHPCGMAFDDKGERLFVADMGSNRIRVIYLTENNRVETLAGSGQVPNEEGPLDSMPLLGPMKLVYLPGDRLVVYCGADQSLKYIDLHKKTFRTLGKNVGPLWDMAYRPEDDAIYMTDPANDRLDRLDMKTEKISVSIQNNAVLTSPGALCVHEGMIFVSDMKTSEIYRIEPAEGAASSAPPTVMTMISTGEEVLELAFTGDTLYAFQSGAVPLAAVWPDHRPVVLTSGSAVQLSNGNPGYFPLLAGYAGMPVGFVVSPLESDRFYISQPRQKINSVVSVRDGHFKEHWYSRDPLKVIRELPDFEYSAQKPPKTFRILVVGTSRVVTAPVALSDEDLSKGKVDMNILDFHSLRMNTFPKKLELLLNTQAALAGVPEHFEVLELGRPGMKLPFFVNEQVPQVVQKYDVDLVLNLLTPTFEEAFEDYFTKPMTPDGIPGAFDEEYLMKPWKERVPPGIPEKFLKRCFDLKLVGSDSSDKLKFVMFQDLLNQGGAEIRSDLLEMLGKPLQVLDHRLRSMKVRSTGKSPLVKFIFIPDPDCDYYEHYESFWSDLCTENDLDLLDLTKPYEDLKDSYYPATEACCHQHYTAYGNEMIAQILLHYLPQKGWIPFTPSGGSK